MAEHSLNELFNLINQQKDAQETLKEYLSKVMSLVRVSLSHEFLTHPPMILYHYLLWQSHSKSGIFNFFIGHIHFIFISKFTIQFAHYFNKIIFQKQ
jgi:hypothetical protein